MSKVRSKQTKNDRAVTSEMRTVQLNDNVLVFKCVVNNEILNSLCAREFEVNNKFEV